MSSKRSTKDQGLRLIIVGLAGWVIPGAGHLLIRERKRALIIFVAITTLFVAGLFIGSIGVVNSVRSKPWFIAQMMYSPAVGVLDKIVQGGEYDSWGRPGDIGQIYTGIAGLLNLLSVLSAVYMAYCGRGEFIGQEEEEPNA